MQQSAIFVKKSLKKNMMNRYSRKRHRKVRDHCHYTTEYKGTTHSVRNWKHSISK